MVERGAPQIIVRGGRGGTKRATRAVDLDVGGCSDSQQDILTADVGGWGLAVLADVVYILTADVGGWGLAVFAALMFHFATDESAEKNNY